MKTLQPAEQSAHLAEALAIIIDLRAHVFPVSEEHEKTRRYNESHNGLTEGRCLCGACVLYRTAEKFIEES